MNLSIDVIHIDDEEDWLYLVEKSIEVHELGFHYRFHKGSIADAILEIQNCRNPVIAIFDLRVGEFDTEYDSLLSLIEDAEKLLTRGHELFVLSGFLSEPTIELLIRRGILRNHIFAKDEWDEERFIEELVAAKQRLEKTLEGWNYSHVSQEICQITLRFDGEAPSLNTTTVIAEREYWIYVSLTALPGVSNYEHLIGSPIRLCLYCRDASTYPKDTMLRMPTAGTVVSSKFSARFHRLSGQTVTDFSLLVYYHNHLMGVLDSSLVVVPS